MELAYPWADKVILLKKGHILNEDIPQKTFVNKDLIRKAHLSIPIFLELYLELVKRGMKESDRSFRTVLDMIQVNESRHGQMQMHCASCGTIHVADCESLKTREYYTSS